MLGRFDSRTHSKTVKSFDLKQSLLNRWFLIRFFEPKTFGAVYLNGSQFVPVKTLPEKEVRYKSYEFIVRFKTLKRRLLLSKLFCYNLAKKFSSVGDLLAASY